LASFSFFVSFKIINHGGRRGNTAWALARWRHLVASHEAMDAIHRAMHPASHCHIRIAIKIASVRRVFIAAINFVVGHNHKLKTMLWL
jgi:hypothetical protein